MNELPADSGSATVRGSVAYVPQGMVRGPRGRGPSPNRLFFVFGFFEEVMKRPGGTSGPGSQALAHTRVEGSQPIHSRVVSLDARLLQTHGSCRAQCGPIFC
jgi:hypothetical protein